MNVLPKLLLPSDCALLMIDLQAGLAFGDESMSRQAVLNNAVALARTAVAFAVPVVISSSASKVYSGPLLPQVQSVLPNVHALERRNMNLWKTRLYAKPW